MSERRWEWVEIIEPRTKEHMYANLTTGECVWDPPPDVRIKKTDDNQWWELFDQNTSRFYYYNATSQKTVWHRPPNCDIIPLAKLQTLKQNTEVRDTGEDVCYKKEISTQTPILAKREKYLRQSSIRSSHSTQTSPHQSKKQHHHHHRHHHHHHHHTSRPLRQDSSTSVLSETDLPLRNSENSETDNGILNGEGSHQLIITSQKPSEASIRLVHKSLDDYSLQSEASLIQHTTYTNRPSELQHEYLDGGSNSLQHRYSPQSYYKQENLSKEELSSIPHGHELSSNYRDFPEITAAHGTPRPKPRSFPRTNPAYVGVQKRDGAPTYKKINIEQPQPPTAIYNQKFYDTHVQPQSDLSSCVPSNIQMIQGIFSESQDKPPSDSDTSHDTSNSSYYFRNILQDSSIMTDSCYSQHSGHSMQSHESSLLKNYREFSDSHSSQGSISQGSLRSNTERDIPSTTPQESLLITNQSHNLNTKEQTNANMCSITNQKLGHPQAPPRTKHHKHKVPQMPYVTDIEITNVNTSTSTSLSEGNYANIPFISQEHEGQVMTLSDLLSKRQNDQLKLNLMTSSINTEKALDQKLDALRGNTTFSQSKDHYIKPETPSSIRTRNSRDTSYSRGMPDHGVDESDNSSIFSTPSPKNRGITSPNLSQQLESHHASLRRKKSSKERSADHMKISHQVLLEKSHSLQGEYSQNRPVSVLYGSNSEGQVIVNPTTGQVTINPAIVSLQRGIDLTDIEQFAVENLNEHKKGLLGKTVPVTNMLNWTKDVIQKPMIRTNDKGVKKEAPDMFKLIQMYMGDRKSKTPNPQIALDITTKGWSLPLLRDEIYIQLCKQTTENPKDDSLRRGWELMAICLVFFPPSTKFHSYLEGFIYRHLDPVMDTTEVPVSHFAAHCQRRLEKIANSGARKGLRKPLLDEIEQAKKSIFNPSMFGSHLDDILLMQKERFPDRELPWIMVILSEEVLRLNGAQTEGIFRVPGDVDEVNSLKIQCDKWILPSECPDPHIPASLLKLWYRELQEPLIPSEFYEECVNNCDCEETVLNIVNNLPEINRLVLCYLIRFLQVFVAEENVLVTKMDTNNLAMVMAPNCLRCESDDPRVIFDNTRKEMAFMRTLISSLDTSFMQGVI